MGWQEDTAQAPKSEVFEPRRVQMPKGRASDEIDKGRRSDVTQIGLINKINPAFAIGLTGMTTARGLMLIVVPLIAPLSWLFIRDGMNRYSTDSTTSLIDFIGGGFFLLVIIASGIA